MRRVVLLSGMLAAGVGPGPGCVAQAQDVDVTALQLKACGLIKDDAARVRCYDRAMGRPDSAPSLVPISPSGGTGQLVPIPQAPPVATPQASVSAAPQGPPAGAQPGAPPPPPAVAVPQSPAVTPTAPETSTVAPAPGPAKTKDDGWFGMRSIVRSITPSGFAGFGGAEARTWQVKADNAALQEASRLLATLESPDEKATLVLQCMNARTEAHLTIPRFLGWEGMRVRYRINDNQANDGVWAASADGRGAVVSDAVGFINSLVDGGTLTLRLTDYEGHDHDLRFSLGTVSGLRSQIATVCRWPSAMPQVSEPPPPASAPREARKKATAPAGVGAPLQLH